MIKINYNKGNFTYRDNGTLHKSLLDKLNSVSCTRDSIMPYDVGSLNTVMSKNNIIDFGSAHYFKYTNSTGRSLAIFSMPGGALRRPDFNIDPTGYDRETDRYIHFWNNLGAGHALMSSPDHLPSLGYYNDEIRGYLDDSGIEKGFFTVKMGSESSEFFYSDTEQYPLYRKEDYDFRYYTMTSSDFSYGKSVFRYLEPGTDITIAGEKYTLKDDFTLDIPYGTDIFDIQIPKHTHVSKVPAGIDCKA